MTISHISEAALTYTVISVIAILVLMNQIKKQRIENVDILIPGKIIRGIFIVGVGVCSGCVLKDGFQGIIGQMLVDYSVVSSIMIFIIGGIIGGMIALKIARTGLKKRKEVL